jgi:hypothetical protein
LTAADLDFTGFIRKANFLKLADSPLHDPRPQWTPAILTLAGLPLTPIQKQLLAPKTRRRKRKT